MYIRLVRFLCLVAFFSQPVFSQTETPKALVPGSAFQHLMKPSGQSVEEVTRENELMRLASVYRFSSVQIKEICKTFTTERAKLEFAMAAYTAVVDQDEFYTVYDAFGKFSTVMRLHDFVQRINNGNMVQQNQGIIYPDWHTYTGPENCSAVMIGEDFQILYDQLTAINNDRGRLSLALSIVKNNCLPVSYVMKYALTISDEELRLDLIKASYPRLFDLNNLRMASQVFRHEKTRDSFMQYVDKQYPTHGYDPLPPNQKIVGCFVKDTDFVDMVTLLGKQDFNNTRQSMAQQMLISGKCFTIKQILEILQLFDTDTSKVEIAKFATDYCVERDKCYLLADCFEFESSKKDFLAFLAGK